MAFCFDCRQTMMGLMLAYNAEKGSYWQVSLSILSILVLFFIHYRLRRDETKCYPMSGVMNSWKCSCTCSFWSLLTLRVVWHQSNWHENRQLESWALAETPHPLSHNDNKATFICSQIVKGSGSVIHMATA